MSAPADLSRFQTVFQVAELAATADAGILNLTIQLYDLPTPFYDPTGLAQVTP